MAPDVGRQNSQVLLNSIQYLSVDIFIYVSTYLSTGPVLLQQPRVQRGLQGAPGEAGLRGGGGRSGHSVDIPHRCLLNVQNLHYLVDAV